MGKESNLISALSTQSPHVYLVSTPRHPRPSDSTAPCQAGQERWGSGGGAGGLWEPPPVTNRPKHDVQQDTTPAHPRELCKMLCWLGDTPPLLPLLPWLPLLLSRLPLLPPRSPPPPPRFPSRSPPANVSTLFHDAGPGRQPSLSLLIIRVMNVYERPVHSATVYFRR